MGTANRLAKNTMLMYIRMIFLMAISFYTSRVVLQKLGVEDFGIYNLVASVVAMFSSLKTIFAASTQRFLSYEMGCGNTAKLNSIYNTSLLINSLIALVFLIVVELVGTWFLNTKINIASNRLFAAKCVFQFSVISTILGIITTTYDAEIIAHEKMNFYACLSIVEGSLKLLIVFVLSWINHDKLIVYSFLLLLISTIILFCDYLFCRLKFNECRLNIYSDKSYFKEMTKFAGWNFLGTNAYVLSQSGLNMILNVFGGPIVNAARGVAYQVNGALTQFINNVVVVINPYCVKKFAAGEKEKTYSAIYLSSKLLFLIQFLIMTPLLLLSENIIKFWLGIVPDYSVIFLQLILFYSLIRTLHSGIDILFKANGEIKYYQICEGILLLMPLLLSYVALYCGAGFSVVFVVMILCDIINLICILMLAKRILGFPIVKYLNSVIVPCVVLTLFMLTLWSFTRNLSNVWLLIISFVSDIIAIAFMIFVGLSVVERNIIVSFLKKKR